MSPDEIKAAVAEGKLRGVPAPGLDYVTYQADGTLSGRSTDGHFWTYGEWRVDDRGRQCFLWDGWRAGHNALYCFTWFKLGDSIYLLDTVDEKEDRSLPVSKLIPAAGKP